MLFTIESLDSAFFFSMHVLYGEDIVAQITSTAFSEWLLVS